MKNYHSTYMKKRFRRIENLLLFIKLIKNKNVLECYISELENIFNEIFIYSNNMVRATLIKENWIFKKHWNLLNDNTIKQMLIGNLWFDLFLECSFLKNLNLQMPHTVLLTLADKAAVVLNCWNVYKTMCEAADVWKQR